MYFGVKCFNRGLMGHKRDTRPAPRRAQSPLPAWVMLCTPHDNGGPMRTPSAHGMWAGNVLCAVLWDIWQKIAIHVRAVLARLEVAPDLNNDSPDYRDAR